MLREQVLSEHNQLTKDSGFVVLDGRTLIRVTGKDRHAFLHNFCTADTKKLEPGRLTEAFVLDGKGKLLGHVFLIASESEILLSTVAHQFEVMQPHLDKYIIREDVQLSDVSDKFATVFVCGPTAEARLRDVCSELPGKNERIEFEFADHRLELAQLELAGDGFMFVVPKKVVTAFSKTLWEAGIQECSFEALEVVRIENATPWFGIDSSAANLPQELRRDDKAISFDKGCYLGQETVARIDAIGHVNQFLVSFKLDAQVEPGTELVADGKKVGRLTSVCWSPNLQSWIGLGFLKRQLCKEGIEVDAGGVSGRVK